MTTPASTSASTAPVASLSADSAIAVCSTFWRSPMRSKSGIRIAGSVGASTAPMSSPVDNGTSNASAATEPVDERGDHTPGTASSPRPIATRLSTRVESCRPAVEEDERHAERQEELDAGRVERDVDGVGDRRSEQDARAARRTSMRGARSVSATSWQTRPATSMSAEREHDVLDGHPAILLPCGGRRDRRSVTADHSATMTPCCSSCSLGFTPGSCC